MDGVAQPAAPAPNPADVDDIGRAGFERQAEDWYPEPAWCVELLADAEPFADTIWDPCCGKGTIPTVFAERGKKVIGTDLVWRGYGRKPARKHGLDFLAAAPLKATGDIVMNPPYKDLVAFINRALLCQPGKIAALTRLSFLASRKRYDWFAQLPVKRVWILSDRPSVPPGDVAVEAKGGMADYCWIVLQRGWDKEPRLNWLSKGEA